VSYLLLQLTAIKRDLNTL